MDSNENSFWKPTSRAVPGRPSPKKLVASRTGPAALQPHGASGGGGGAGGATSATFQDFQQSCSDAWDLGDDEFCILSNEMKGNCNCARC